LGRRQITFFIQRRKRGFDDSELWSLDDTIIRFTLPRLKAFRNLHNGSGPMGYPAGLAEDFGIYKADDVGNVTQEQNDKAYNKWLEILDKMIESMEMWVRSEGAPEMDGWDYKGKYDPIKGELNRNKYQEGMDLFHLYFHGLWD